MRRGDDPEEIERQLSGERPTSYCIVPPELEDKLFDTLKRHYADDPSIEVIVERRVADRRMSEERRRRDIGPPEGTEDRRRIRNDDGRRVGERRATLVPLMDPPDLPRKARRYAASGPGR
jgi:hypothetical protein